MDTRKQNERDFHNNRFDENSSDPRQSLWGIYAITNTSDMFYQSIVKARGYNKTILDYGCGYGENTLFLSSFASKVKAIDISDSAIKTLKNNQTLNNVEYLVMDAEKTSFDNNTFDVVCGRAILHHLDFNTSLEEIARILKPSGTGVFVEPLGHNPLINLFRKLTPSKRTVDEHPLTQDDIALIESKFDNVNVKAFYIFTLLAVPFNKTRIFNKLIKLLNGIDQLIFKLLPFTKKYAWITVLTFSNPKKEIA